MAAPKILGVAVTMKDPICFSEISYYDDEFRGDLIVTEGVLYFLPTRRSGYDRVYLIGGFPDRILNWVIKSTLIFVAGLGVQDIIEIFRLMVRFGRRASVASGHPKIIEPGIWSPGQTSVELQRRLDNYVERKKRGSLDFKKDSLPKPTRFALAEIKNVHFKWRLTFTSEFDHHDFGISPFRRKQFQSALISAGFLER